MGMTIDESITWLNTDDFESKGFADATSIAIDVMRKYQKIQQIIKDCNECELVNDYALEEIKEVVEDGQNIIKD